MTPLTPSNDDSILGLLHLKRWWQKSLMKGNGEFAQDAHSDEFNLDMILIDGLNLGLGVALGYLYQERPSEAQLAQWILDKNGGELSSEQVASVNDMVIRALSVTDETAPLDTQIPKILSEDALAFWDQNGYVVVENAIPPASCQGAEQAIWDHLNMSPTDPESWYHSAS